MTVVPTVLSGTSVVLKIAEDYQQSCQQLVWCKRHQMTVPAVLLATGMVLKTSDDNSTSSLVSIWCDAEDTD